MIDTTDPFVEVDAIPAQRGPVCPVTGAQKSYLLTLLDRKLIPALAERAKAKIETMERREASKLIDNLKALPDLPKAPAPGTVTEDGMYRNPNTGDIFKVQRAVHGSGNLYAKLLIIDRAWERDADGKVVVEGEAHFEYAPGALKTLQASWRMDLAEAKKYGALYGVCVRCGKTLTLEESIERAMGRWCASRI